MRIIISAFLIPLKEGVKTDDLMSKLQAYLVFGADQNIKDLVF